MASAWGSSWGSAWGNSWGSIAPPIVIDTHDGADPLRKRRDKAFEEEVEARDRRKAQILDAYEQIVEGRPAIALEIAQEFAPPNETADFTQTPYLDLNRLLSNLGAVERIWAEYLEMDDEEVLTLL